MCSSGCRCSARTARGIWRYTNNASSRVPLLRNMEVVYSAEGLILFNLISCQGDLKRGSKVCVSVCACVCVCVCVCVNVTDLWWRARRAQRPRWACPARGRWRAGEPGRGRCEGSPVSWLCRDDAPPYKPHLKGDRGRRMWAEKRQEYEQGSRYAWWNISKDV